MSELDTVCRAADNAVLSRCFWRRLELFDSG